MAYFPFMIQLNDKRVLIVGGGAVAARKARQMCEFGACVHVVAPEICEELLAAEAEYGAQSEKTEQAVDAVRAEKIEWDARTDDAEKIEHGARTEDAVQTEEAEDIVRTAKTGQKECAGCSERVRNDQHIQIDRRAVCASDLDAIDVCIMATDDEELNSRYAALCRRQHILANVVDVKKDCDFYFPAVIRQGEVVVSVSTGGSSPMLASRIKQEIRNHLRPDYGRIADELREMRETVLAQEPEEHVRKEIFAQAVEEKMQHPTIRIGTRGSRLALIQTEMAIAQLARRYPDTTFEPVIIKTGGDRQQHQPISSFGGKSVFVDAIEEALLAGTIDLAVHSAKDMGNPCRDGLVIAAALARGAAGDVLIRRKCPSSDDGETHFTVGTGSLRRRCQLRELYPHVTFTEMRGNVTTRIEKLRNGDCDALVLAAAGIERLSLAKEDDLSYDYLRTDDMLPAAGQGVIAVEAVAGTRAASMAQAISDFVTETELRAERAVIRAMNAGCHEPIGVYAQLTDGDLRIRMIYEQDGQVRRYEVTGAAADYAQLAEKLTEKCRGRR